MAAVSPVAINPKSKKGDADAFINVATGKVISLNQAQQLIAASKAASKRTPIGVPKGYTVAPQLSPEDQASQNAAYAYGYPTAKVGPQYFKGDEWGNIPNFPSNPGDIQSLQAMLEKIGYLKPGSYVPSVWNQVSASAFANILKEANQGGADWISQLNADSSAIDKAGALNQKQLHRNPLTIKLTDPATIADTVNAVSKDLHGTYLTPDDIAKFTAQYQQSESDYQTQTYNTSGFNPITGQQDTSGVGSDPGQPGVDVVTKAPDMQALASKTIREGHPQEFQKNTFTDRMDEMLAALRGPGGSSGQVGPR